MCLLHNTANMFIEATATGPHRRTVLKAMPPVSTYLRYCLSKEVSKTKCGGAERGTPHAKSRFNWAGSKPTALRCRFRVLR